MFWREVLLPEELFENNVKRTFRELHLNEIQLIPDI